MKNIRNPFTQRVSVIKLAVSELQSTKFCTILLVSLMLAGILSLSPAISSLMNSVVIRNSGKIATVITPLAYNSEIRGVFIHCGTYSYPVNITLVAETLASYGIQAVYGEWASLRGGWSDHNIRMARLTLAIPAFHAVGIEVHVSMDVLYSPTTDQSEVWCVDYLGNPYPWGCPTKQATRDFLKAIVENISSYDIDGFVFDYIRYDDVSGICYCSDCRAKFEEWLGEGTITDWTPFYPGGSRFEEYRNWRNIPINELVRDMRNWMLAIKPNLKFSLAAWTYFDDCPTYWRKYLGQDTGDWIKSGYLDMVAPMMYTVDLTRIQSELETNFKYMVGGPEGKIPMVPFITTGIPGEAVVSPTQFKAVVDKIREMGADGWIIWRYGGPGVDSRVAPDIRDYLSIIDMPDAFALQDIGVSTSGAVATITWLTDLPATSKVEYSTSPLFNASFELWHNDFSSWNMKYINGTVIEGKTPVTTHNVILTNLSPGTRYYFRVQSQDSSGIASSTVLTFMTP